MRYFVYLLQSISTPTSQRMYIGFTPKPRRRLRQHNGEIKGGAVKTSKHRPWEHVCIVSGFPNKFVAYMFEHQWQSCFGHNKPSRVLKDVLVGLDYRSKGWKGRFMILQIMLQIPLWRQMNLVVHFLNLAHLNYFESLERSLPRSHRTECCFVVEEDVDEMHVESKDKSVVGIAVGALLPDETLECMLCSKRATDSEMTLYCCPSCNTTVHLACLGQHAARVQVLEAQRRDRLASAGSGSGDVAGAAAGSWEERENLNPASFPLPSQTQTQTQATQGAGRGKGKSKAATAAAEAPMFATEAEVSRGNLRPFSLPCPGPGCGHVEPRGRATKYCFKPAALAGRLTQTGSDSDDDEEEEDEGEGSDGNDDDDFILSPKGGNHEEKPEIC